jgi:hypothetical protein
MIKNEDNYKKNDDRNDQEICDERVALNMMNSFASHAYLC